MAFGELLLMLSTVMLGSYLFFIVLPVDSPYYLSPHLGPPLSGHFFFDFVHQMSGLGGARGGSVSQRARVGCGCRDPGRVAAPASARVTRSSPSPGV